MGVSDPRTIARFSVDSLQVQVYDDRAGAGRAAALAVGQAIRDRQQAAGHANVVFAAAPSQNEFLAGLVASQGDRLVAAWSAFTWMNTWDCLLTTRPRFAVICKSTCSGWLGWIRAGCV